MITRKQVADLQPGDVVEYRYEGWPEGTVVSGPVRRTDGGQLIVADRLLMDSDGSVTASRYGAEVTVVSRAPRPLYVNHPRTEPVKGDVVSHPSVASGRQLIYAYTGWPKYAGIDPHGHETCWVSVPFGAPDAGPLFHVGSLRLLVDGETGQVVQ